MSFDKNRGIHLGLPRELKPSKIFINACNLAQIEPTRRQFRKFHQKKTGLAYRNMKESNNTSGE